MALTSDLVPPVPPMSGVFIEPGTVARASRMAPSSLQHTAGKVKGLPKPKSFPYQNWLAKPGTPVRGDCC